MGCGCGGKSSSTPTIHYELTYPNGTVQRFLVESQAMKEQAKKGGTIKKVPI
jgi:hypothetical protein